jgi:DNA-binding beta-propeller fold protein YncE
VSPIQGSSAQPLTPTLQWDAATDAQSYTVEIATADSFGAADVVSVQSSDALSTSYAVPASMLLPGVIYYWRVTAVNASGSTVATGAPQRFSSPYLVLGAHGVAVTPNGAELVVASDVNNGPIDIINLTSHTVTDTIHTGVASQPMGVAISPDGTEALATLLTNGSGGVNGVAVIDLTTRSLVWNVSDPCVATTLSDIAYFPSGTLAAIPDLSGGCTAMGLSYFDPDASPSQFTFVNFSDTNNPLGVAITPDGFTALVTMQLDSRLYKIAFPGGTVSHLSLPSFSSGVAITPDGTRAVVASSDVEVVTLSDGSLAPITLDGDSPNGDFHNVAITADGSMAVVVGGASVQVISLADNTVLSHYPAQNGTSVAVSPDGMTAFVTDSGDGWVRVLQIP